MSWLQSGPAGVVESTILHNKERRENAEDTQRDLQVADIEKSIQGIQARTDLSPDQKAAEINKARQVLQGLYKPHEGPKLFDALGRIFGKKGSPAPAPTGQVNPMGPQAPTLDIKPGMTVGDIMAMGSPQPAPKTEGQPFQAEDGKWYQWERDAQGNVKATPVQAGPPAADPKERESYIAGLAKMYAEHGLKPPEKDMGEVEAYMAKNNMAPKVKNKGFKYVPGTNEILNQDTGESYSQKELKKGVTDDGEEIPAAALNAWKDAQEVNKQKSDAALEKFRQRLQLQQNAINAAWGKSDHTQARKLIDAAKVDSLQANVRMATMDKALPEALQGNQQAMMNIVANHIGMTLGAQKGSRITRAVWDEAVASAPWLEQKLSHFFVQDANGDRILVAPMSGVTLTPDQMKQMVQLAHDKADILKDTVANYEAEFPEGESGPPGSQSDDDAIIKILNGK